MTVRKSNVLSHFTRTSFSQELTARVRHEVSSVSSMKAPSIYFFYYAAMAGITLSVMIGLWFAHDFWIRCSLATFLAILIMVNGTSVGHESNHNASSNSNLINRMIGFIFYDLFFGISSFYWKYYHNISHHMHTNMTKNDKHLDPDHYVVELVKSEPKPWKRAGKLFFFLSVNIPYLTNFYDYSRLKRNSQGLLQNKKELGLLIVGRLVFYSMILVIPSLNHGVVTALATYAYTYGLASLMLGCIFLIAHSTSDVDQIKLSDEKHHFSWEEAQVRSSANYSMDNRLTTLLHGGLNYQIEHHLFPTVHPSFYPKISKIVRELCEKHQVPYVSYPSVFTGLKQCIVNILRH